jgi:predicted metal-dependent hydrolase
VAKPTWIKLFALAEIVRRIGGVHRTAPQLPLFPADSSSATEKPGETPGFSVRESARAKRLSIKVYPRGRVEVVVPKRTRAAEVESFVSENKDWIRRSVQSFVAKFGEESTALPTRIDLQGVGQSFIVAYRQDKEVKGVRYRQSGRTVIVYGRIADKDLCVKALRRWLSTVARRELAPSLRSLSLELNLPYKKTHIRTQRTCWGSHSSTGTISINLCLLFVAPKVLRYLMIHELCHSRHMNHSKKFWGLVAGFEPDYRRLDQELGNSWRSVPGWMGIY